MSHVQTSQPSWPPGLGQTNREAEAQDGTQKAAGSSHLELEKEPREQNYLWWNPEVGRTPCPYLLLSTEEIVKGNEKEGPQSNPATHIPEHPAQVQGFPVNSSLCRGGQGRDLVWCLKCSSSTWDRNGRGPHWKRMQV